MKIAYVDCFSGVSGDMLLAALVDAGLPIETLQNGLDQLHLPEKIEIKVSEVHKGAMRACNVEVIVPESHHHRHLSDILDILAKSQLSDVVKEKTSKIFTLLAEAEARVHGEPVEHIHFHEVGALDSIADVTGVVIGLEALGIEQLYASPLPYGTGMVKCDHGLIPLPAPATLELFKAVNAPLISTDADVELVTPTGAAILGSLAIFERPTMQLKTIGVGAGKRDLAWPNLIRLLIGETPGISPNEMVQLETSIDDMNPQFYGYIMEKLLSSGAKDVSLTPIQMKKNRPGTLLGVIADRKDESFLAELILRETTTMGLRVQPIGRHEAVREFRKVKTIYGELTLKVKVLNGKVIHSTPEYEDCVRLAKENNITLAEVYQSICSSCEGE